MAKKVTIQFEEDYSEYEMKEVYGDELGWDEDDPRWTRFFITYPWTVFGRLKVSNATGEVESVEWDG